MKQTAVNFLIDEMQQRLPEFYAHFMMDMDSVYDKAKAMEKEQITAFAKLWEEKLLDGRINSADDLYNETYKQ